MHLSEKERNRAIIGLSLFGIGSMIYLAYLHYAPAHSSVCNFGQALSCDVVNRSQFADILGIPVSLLGIGFFLGVIGLTYARLKIHSYHLISLASIFTLIFSGYLSYIEYVYLGTVCVFCEGSKLLMLLILLLSLRGIRHRAEKISPSWALTMLGLGALFTIAVGYLQFQ